MTITTKSEPRLFGGHTIPCFSWCSIRDEDDEACYGHERRTPASLYPRQRFDGGWQDEYMTVYSSFCRVDGTEPQVHVGRGECFGITLTPSEARQLAASLIEVADEIEGAGR